MAPRGITSMTTKWMNLPCRIFKSSTPWSREWNKAHLTKGQVQFFKAPLVRKTFSSQSKPIYLFSHSPLLWLPSYILREDNKELKYINNWCTPTSKRRNTHPCWSPCLIFTDHRSICISSISISMYGTCLCLWYILFLGSFSFPLCLQPCKAQCQQPIFTPAHSHWIVTIYKASRSPLSDMVTFFSGSGCFEWSQMAHWSSWLFLVCSEGSKGNEEQEITP